MDLAQALRLSPLHLLHNTSPKFKEFGGGREGVALVGAGGKTTALFQLARSLSGTEEQPVIVTAATHLHIDQGKLADSHWVGTEHLANLEANLRGVMLVTGSLDGDRTTGLDNDSMSRLRKFCGRHTLPLLIEADGSRQRPLKAPAEHEPPIPEFVETVVVVAGLSGLGKPLTDKFVHRPEIFSRLSGLSLGEPVTPETLFCVLTHPAGGLKNIPAQARRGVLLNQADTSELQAQGKFLAEQLSRIYDEVIIASLEPRSPIENSSSTIHAVYEPVAGIILAAGEARRFGSPKQLLDYAGSPFVRSVAQTALAAGLSPVVVVTGANAEQVEAAVKDLPVKITRNTAWRNGQSSSIQAGLQALPANIGAVLFLLADQPQVTPTVIRTLVEDHALGLSPVVALLVAGQRANPALFDRVTFPDLMALTGDVGGRAIFSKYPPKYLTWHDEKLLVDIDTPADLKKFKNTE